MPPRARQAYKNRRSPAAARPRGFFCLRGGRLAQRGSPAPKPHGPRKGSQRDPVYFVKVFFAAPLTNLPSQWYYLTNIEKGSEEKSRFSALVLTREPGQVKAGRIQETENGLGAARAKGKSRKPATGTPVKASGCNRFCGAAMRPSLRKRAVKQGGTTRVSICSRPWRHGRAG